MGVKTIKVRPAWVLAGFGWADDWAWVSCGAAEQCLGILRVLRAARNWVHLSRGAIRALREALLGSGWRDRSGTAAMNECNRVPGLTHQLSLPEWGHERKRASGSTIANPPPPVAAPSCPASLPPPNSQSRHCPGCPPPFFPLPPPPAAAGGAHEGREGEPRHHGDALQVHALCQKRA